VAIAPERHLVSWQTSGCSLAVAESVGRLGNLPTTVASRVTDQAPTASGLPRSLVVALSVAVPIFTERPSDHASEQSRSIDIQFAAVMDDGLPVARPWRWETSGDAGAAWDALNNLRLGNVTTARATGVAAALTDGGVATIPLEPSACGASIGTPWFAWSSGSLAVIVGSGTDADEQFWDLAVLWRRSLNERWSIAYRASAYTGLEVSGQSIVGLEARGDQLRLMDLAAEPRTVADSNCPSVGELVEAARARAANAPGQRSPREVAGHSAVELSPTGTLFQIPRVPIEGFRGIAGIRQGVDAINVFLHGKQWVGSRLSWALFWGGLVLYLVTRLWGITSYPIAFDGDEAGIVVLGRALLEGGFRDGYGIWFPLFFSYPNWNPDVGVYVHLLASTLFGMSVTVARVTAVLLTVPTPIALAAALKWGFSVRSWWLAPYVLSALPIWFHLSRTAYDSATWVAFFASAVAAYYRYRYHDSRWALTFVMALLLTFYSNAVAHLFAVLLAAAVVVIDWRYHIANWRAWRVPIGIGVLGLLPLITFLTKNPAYLLQRLSSTHPHWGDGSISLVNLVLTQVRAAAVSLNPMVWFVSENRGRYVDVTGYHNYYPGTMPLLPWWVGILAAIGLSVVWLPAFKGRRALLLALLAMSVAPTAIARFAPTRSLAAVVPIVLLTVYWVDAVLPRGHRVTLVAGAAALAVTVTSSFLTLHQALTSQSTRVQDYGGYGIQWGSKEVFALVNQRLRSTAGSRVMVTTDWTWGGHHFIKFFIGKQDLAAGRVFLGSLETVLKSREPWGPDLWAILSPAQLEYLRERMRLGSLMGAGSRVIDAAVTDQIAHPDGSPGFLMVHLREAPNIAEILAAERAAATRPTYSDMTIDGQTTRVGTTAIDDGLVEPVLNRAPNALVRFAGPNPTVIDVSYPTPRPVSSIRLVLGAGMWRVTARLSGQENGSSLEIRGAGEQDGPNSVVTLNVDGPPFQARRIVYEILQPNATEDDSTVHLYSLEVRPVSAPNG
jgi:hypothetical protein